MRLPKNWQETYKDKLDTIYETALSKGYTLPLEMVMVGACIATVGTRVIKVATLSGGNANTILNIIKGGLGKDVVLIGDKVPLKTYKSILNSSLQHQAVTLQHNLGSIPVGDGLPFPFPIPNYPVGSCAAQKLLAYLIRQTDVGNNIRIKKIIWLRFSGRLME